MTQVRGKARARRRRELDAHRGKPVADHASRFMRAARSIGREARLLR